jgi:DNA-binding MarR family transcriptional regulator
MSDDDILKEAADGVLETLAPVWDRIRSKLRAAAIGKFGITLEQFHTLRHIRQGQSTVRDLAERRQVSPAAASQAVEILVKKGLVTRSQEGKDRRLVTLALTPYAREVLEANFEESRRWVRERMSGLRQEELANAARAMATLRATFLDGDDGEGRRRP